MKNINDLNLLQHNRECEIWTQFHLKRILLTDALQQNARGIPDLQPPKKVVLLSFYLTKGLFYADNFTIDTPRLFWFLQTVSVDPYDIRKTSVEISNMWLLYGHPSCATHIGFWSPLPVEDTTQFVLYDDLRYDDLYENVEDVLTDFEEQHLPLFKFLIHHNEHAIDYFQHLLEQSKNKNSCTRFLDEYLSKRRRTYRNLVSKIILKNEVTSPQSGERNGYVR